MGDDSTTTAASNLLVTLQSVRHAVPSKAKNLPFRLSDDSPGYSSAELDPLGTNYHLLVHYYPTTNSSIRPLEDGNSAGSSSTILKGDSTTTNQVDMHELSNKCYESQRPQEPQQLTTAVESDIVTMDHQEAISKLEKKDDEPKMMDWTTNASGVPTIVTAAPHDHDVLINNTLPHRCGDGTISSAVASRQPQDDRKPLPLLSTAKSRIDQQEEGPADTSSSLKATTNDGDKNESSTECCETQQQPKPQPMLLAVESAIVTVGDKEMPPKLEGAPHDHDVLINTLPHRCDGTISSAVASRQPQDDRKPLPLLSTANSRIDQQEEGPADTSSLKATTNDGDKNESSTECCETQRQPKSQPMLPLAVESDIVTVGDKEMPPKLEGAEPNNNDWTTTRRNETPQAEIPQNHDVQDTAPPHCGTNSSVSSVASRNGEQDQKQLSLPQLEDFKKDEENKVKLSVDKVQLDKDVHKNNANNAKRVTHKVPPRSTVGNVKREISQQEAPKKADLSSSLDVQQSSDRGMELTIEQRRLLYEEEAARIFQQEEARRKQQRLEQHWDFQLAMINVIALAADRVVGCCVKKNYGQINGDDDDYEDHEKAE
jgi:hypothetical protein